MSPHIDAGARKSFEVWIFDGRAPELLCRAATLADARVRWGYSRHAAIYDERGRVVDTRRGADRERLAAIEAAREGRAVPVKSARPLPHATAAEPMPERSSEASSAPVEVRSEVREAPVPAREEVPLAATSPTKPIRPAATRPPLPRRRVASPAVPALAPPPIVAPAAPAAPAVPASLLAPTEPATGPVPDEVLAHLRRLVDQLGPERDAHRDRADAAEHRVEQLRGEVESLTTDLTVARRDLAHATIRWTEATGERDEARDLLELALTTGLAAVTEARAETMSVLRQSGELSRQLGALRDGCVPPPPAAPAADLDEVVFLRVATRAARMAVRASREDRALRVLAESVGGVEALTRLVNYVQEILRGWQP